METSKTDRRTLNRFDGYAAALVLLLLCIVVGMFTGVCRGSAGAPGEAGAQGVPGPQGSPGDIATVRGPQGDPGTTGPAGAKGPAGAGGPSGPPGVAGPAGELGPEGPPGQRGDPGPMGEPGAPGATGVAGAAGAQGARGDIGYLSPAPTALENPALTYTLLFRPEGLTVPNAAPSGSEFPNLVDRRQVTLRDRQAVRVQYAHSLAGGSVRLAVEFFDTSTGTWRTLIPAYGQDYGPFEPHVSAWHAVPLHVTQAADVTLRSRIFGDGTLDPALTFISLDAK